MVRPTGRGAARTYTVSARTDGGSTASSGLLVNAQWEVTAFAWSTDPREDAAAWRGEAQGGVSFLAGELDLPFGGGGPSDLEHAARLAPALVEAQLPADRFGTLARTALTLPAGRWLLRSASDDGIRVWADGELVIDDWTHHATRRLDAELLLERERRVELRVEHFELDGAATLSLRIERAAD